MKRVVLLVVASSLAGGALGYAVAVLTLVEAPASGSRFLREFSFEAVLRAASPAEWKVLHDRTSPLRLGGSRRISRRFVARATLPQSEVQAFAQKFEQAVEGALPHQVGEEGINEAAASAERPSSFLQLPRYWYRTENAQGILDAGIVANDGSVTVIISVIE